MSEMIALVDFINLQGTKMGMMLGLEERDLEKIFYWVKGIRMPPGATLIAVTIVKSSKTPPTHPYIHPPTKREVHANGSISTPSGPVWFELVVSVLGEEE
jgi:hypothetical protein